MKPTIKVIKVKFYDYDREAWVEAEACFKEDVEKYLDIMERQICDERTKWHTVIDRWHTNRKTCHDKMHELHDKLDKTNQELSCARKAISSAGLMADPCLHRYIVNYPSPTHGVRHDIEVLAHDELEAKVLVWCNCIRLPASPNPLSRDVLESIQVRQNQNIVLSPCETGVMTAKDLTDTMETAKMFTR